MAVAGAVGGAIKAFGSAKADSAQADAERANADFFQEQSRYAGWKRDRDVENFEEQLETILGQQRGIFAKSGIQLSGTAKRIQEQTKARGAQQKQDILKEGNFNVRLAMLKAQRSNNLAGGIDKAIPYKTAGSLISSGAQIYGAATSGGGPSGETD